ncbi:rho GTPase-activating protein gacN-like [Coccinella septempunctata]|uniref:rho GTPase-activating protein gacN-like n=1 Tax=Coccinella septempunctata TaxID=41139 RepID=UPI001D06DF68|nr:rho GTPase-activating protein gacN-like [Coccinella septempunctata]
MFMNDVHKKDEIKEIAIQDLRRIGVKFRRKKSKPNAQETRKTSKCFKIELSLLPTQVVTLSDGQQLLVPTVVHQLCSFILKKVDTEGLFRKEGSKSRQNEIKLSLNAGCKIEDDYHVIDVAGILKTFLRELPEPLIPTTFHDYFLRCTILEKEKLEAVLLLCLLLPQENLNTLAYLLRFFNAIAKRSTHNKMSALNLAIVIGPNIIPFLQDKSYTAQHKIKKICELVQLLIENANKVGIIPNYIIDQVADSNAVNEENVVEKKKKRRSGSLTRMFNGLRKMVGNRSEDMSPTIVTPDLLLTPSISRSVKKRKIESLGLSNKKKKEVISKLPEGKILKMPFAPISTPISENPKGKEKKTQWYTKNKSSKSSKAENEENVRSSRSSLGPRSIIERRWSAVSSVAAFRRNKKRNSYGGSQHQLNAQSSKSDHDLRDIKIDENSDDGFVKVSKVEYEQIKNRVSEIERRISLEMDNVQSKMDAEPRNCDSDNDRVKNVQTAYEQTLVQAEHLSPTTDHLARRLSRELKIRRSSDHIVIRSPSARKIGTLKRRSRELERQNGKLLRNQSWHVSNEAITIPRVNLRRRRASSTQSASNSVQSETGITNTPTLNVSDRVLRSSVNKNISTTSMDTPGKQSFHSAISTNTPTSDPWTSAEKYFSSLKTPCSDVEPPNSRPSVAKLRSQNAGMVLAKAKLFDNMVDSDNSNLSDRSVKSNTKVKTTYKIGSVRQSDVKLAQRVKSLKADEKKVVRKNSSPRRNRLNLSQKQKLQAVRQLVEAQRNRRMNTTPPENECSVNIDKGLLSPIKYTPRRSPVIKKSLITRSPKRLCRTPHLDRSTPLKVFTPKPMEY